MSLIKLQNASLDIKMSLQMCGHKDVTLNEDIKMSLIQVGGIRVVTVIQIMKVRIRITSA